MNALKQLISFRIERCKSIESVEHVQIVLLDYSFVGTDIVMKKHEYAASEIIGGYVEFVQERVDDGWSPFLLTFCFKPGCSQREMQDEIDRVYSTFVTRAVRRPHSQRGRKQRPLLVTCLDAFSFKLDRCLSRRGLAATEINDGKHQHGILAVPSETRLRESVPEHFAGAGSLYAKGSLLRLNVKTVDVNLPDVVDYALKALKSGAANFDDVLLFPKAACERGHFIFRVPT